MLLRKLKVVAAVVAALAVVALGGGLLYRVQVTAEAAAPSPTALAPQVGKQDSSKDNETLKNTLLTLQKAWHASDGKPGTDTYGQFLADDFFHFTTNGEKVDKAAAVRAHMGYHVGADYKMSDVELIRLNETAAILTFKIEYQSISNATGKAAGPKRNLLYSTTWVQRGGGWLIVFAAALDLSPNPPNPPHPPHPFMSRPNYY